MKNNKKLKTGLLINLLISGIGSTWASDSCKGNKTTLLRNGNIVTMDAQQSIVNSIAIKNGRIVALGNEDKWAIKGPKRCQTEVNLHGLTVIPGLIDSHIHLSEASKRPFFALWEIENISSIAELQALLTERASQIPAGEMIVQVGGFSADSLGGRLPTREELDVVPNPVFLGRGLFTDAQTNTNGRNFLNSMPFPFTVPESGLVSGTGGFPPPSGMAFFALKSMHTQLGGLERSAKEVMAYASSLGLTTAIDSGEIGGEDNGGKMLHKLSRKGELSVRMRINYAYLGGAGGFPDENGVFAAEARMDNSISQLGDQMFKVSGIGEFVAGSFGTLDQSLLTGGFSTVAKRGWRLHQHSINTAEHDAHVTALETVNAQTPIAEMRWSLDHVFDIDDSIGNYLNRLQDIGAGVTVQNQPYFISGGNNSGLGLPNKPAPFRTIVDSGIHAGAGTDAPNASAINPWLSLYHMVSGKNAAGELHADAQPISRLEALSLYTMGSAWFSFDDHQLGSLEIGKLGDLVVLSDDYFSVEEEDIKKIRSLMTIVDGNIVHLSPVIEGQVKVHSVIFPENSRNRK